MISVIVCSIKPQFLEQLKLNIKKTIGVAYELLAYDNREGRRGICEVYNELAKCVRYEIICFAHEDILFETHGWGKILLNTMIGFTNEGSMSSKLDQNSSLTKKVKASRLKDFLNDKVDFLKIDIEGAEYAVLKDIEPVLLNVQNLFLEYHGSFKQSKELVHIFNILNNKGFQFYIKEATSVYKSPFFDSLDQANKKDWDVQLNIFCFRTQP